MEIGAAEMTVYGERPVESSLARKRRRRAQPEAAHDSGRTEIRRALDAVGDVLVGHRTGAEGRNRQAQRPRAADRVSEVHLASSGEARRDDVFRRMARGISANAV